MKNKWFVFASVAGFLILVGIGCGQTAPYVPPAIPQTTVAAVGALACYAGTFAIDGACYQGADFITACQYSAHGQIISLNGTNVCKTSDYYVGGPYGSGSVSFSTYYLVPSIDPTTPSYTLNALPVQVSGNYSNYYGYPALRLHKSDTLRLAATGGWSYKSQTSYSWSIFSTSTWNTSCNDVTVNGTTSSGAVVNAPNGQPAALFASDGTTAYKIGSSAKVVIQNEGSLYLGFNAPNLTTSSGCSMASITSLAIDRCSDASGNLYPCP
ncbi:MAG: hypothetical protein ACXWPM_04250 [Bdellovibrionota bacterium]